MAANDGSMNIGFGLDASAASKEVARLKRDLDGLTKNLVDTQKIIENNVKRMTADLTKAVKAAKDGTATQLRAERREIGARGQALGDASRGSEASRIYNAAYAQTISDLRYKARLGDSRLNNELVNIYTQKIRNTDEMIAARMRRELSRSRTFMGSNTRELLEAREYHANLRNQNLLRERQIGGPAAAMERTRERIASNGGADIIGIQSRLLVGYQALSLAFNAARNLSTFVVDLDNEFRQFQAITATTNSEMGQLKGNLIAVSEATKFTALEVTKAATVMGQAGLSAREVGDSIGSVALLATAAGTDLNQAVDVVTSTLSIFNLQTSQTVDVANTMTAALNKSKLTIDKLVLGFQYAGNIAAQTGITYQELTGILGALANSGIRSGSTLGTGLRQLMIDIQNPTEKFRKILNGLNLSQQDVNISTNGFIPVLKKLKEAGFDTSLAFEAFEVRAAAAYSALSNNVNLATQLQEEFILTTAAVEANEIQMLSLANTYKKFQSVVGTIFYRAFEPMVAVLQQVIDGLANTLSILNQYPALLQTLGILATAFGTALALSTASALFRGIAQNIPMLASLGTSMGAAAVGTTALGVAAQRSTPLVGGLMMMLRNNPFIFLASTFFAAAVAMKTFGNDTADAKERVDSLNGEINVLNGDLDTANSRIDAINQTVGNLIKQKTALDRDPLMRQARILEVKQSFKELSTEISTTTGTVDELIEALNNLKAINLAKDIPILNALIAAQKNLVAELQAKIEISTKSGASGEGLREQTGNLIDVNGKSQSLTSELRNLNSAPGATNASVQKQLDVFRQRMIGELLGDTAGKVASILFGQLEVEKVSTDELQGMLANLDASIYPLQTQATQLGTKRTLGTITPEEVDILNKIPAMLELLATLKEGLQPLTGDRLNTDSALKTIERLEGERTRVGIRTNSSVRDLANETQRLNAEVTAAKQEIDRTGSRGSKADLLVRYRALQKTFEDKLTELGAKAETLTKDLAEQNPDLDVEDVRSTIKSTIFDPIAALRSSLRVDTTNINKTVQKGFIDQLKAQQKLIDTQIIGEMKRSGRAITEAEVVAIEDHIRRMMDRKIRIAKQIFDAEILVADNEEERSTLELVLKEEQAVLQERKQQYIETLAEHIKDISTDALDVMKKSVDDQADQLKEKINDAIASIRKLKPGAALDALVASINKMIEELGQLQLQSQSLDFQSTSLDQGAEISGGRADRAALAMKFFLGKGYSQAQASGIVGNLLAESGLDSTARGDGGRAMGLAQWHPDRQAGLDAYVNRPGKNGDRYGFQNQLEYVDYELKTRERDAYLKLLQARTPAEATKAMIGYERPAGYTRSSPESGHNYVGRLRFAQTLNTGDYSGDAKDIQDSVADLTKAQTEAAVRGIKAASTQSVRNSTQQIETIVTQARISTDPEAIKGMIESVNEQYKAILKAKADAFDAENQEALSNEDPGVLNERADLLEGIRADQNQKITQLLEQYWKAADELTQKPVEEAQRALDEAQRPENTNRFSQEQIIGLQNNVALAERKALVEQLNIAERNLLSIQAQAAAALQAYGAGSAEANYWLQQQAEAERRVAEATSIKNAADAATAQQSGTIVQAIESATNAWARQHGILDQFNEVVPLAKQVENSWGQVLDGLSNGFATLFEDLAMGTMSAEEAFRKFALSTIQMFIQMIAKALAYQLIMGALGGGSGSGAGGGIIGALLGVVAPGAANGGIRRAAAGELITNGVPFRDSALRRVMPGEMLLRQSAVQAIGEDKLTAINNMGNRQFSQGIGLNAVNDNSPGNGTVNVWVVSPDQVPPPGPNDIIAVVADNIQRRGSIRSLIQSVQIGSV